MANLDEDGALAITIPTPTLPQALLLIDDTFASQLAAAEQEIAALKITDQASAQHAAELQGMLTRAGTALDTERLKLLRPFLDTQKAINAAAQNVAARIELSKRAVKAELTRYDDAQRRLAEEAERRRREEAAAAERARQAEIARLERIAREEREANERRARELMERQEAERRRLEAEQAAALAARPKVALNLDLDEPEPLSAGTALLGQESLDLGDEPPPMEKSETERRIEALQVPVAPAPPIVAPKLKGLSFRSWVEIVRTDPSLLPDSLVTRVPDTKAIRAAYIASWKQGDPLPVCPGVVFEIKRESITR